MSGRWWIWGGLVVVGLLLAACGGSASPPTSVGTAPSGAGPQTPANAPDGGPPVNVVAKDFAFALDNARVPAGTVTFRFRNDGVSAHDFVLRGEGVEHRTCVIGKGKAETLTVTLRPGVYTYICSVAGHEQLGMTGTLTVV